MYGDNIKRKVIAELEENSVAVKALLDPPFEIHEVFDFITEAVDLVEVMAPENIDGRTKKAIVQAVIAWADEKFKITATVIGAIIPRWLRWLPFKRIAAKLFPLLVDLIVSVLNRYVWKAEKVDTGDDAG